VDNIKMDRREIGCSHVVHWKSTSVSALLATRFTLVSWLACSSTQWWRLHVSLKHQLTSSGLRGFLSQKTELFRTTAVRTLDPTNADGIWRMLATAQFQIFVFLSEIKKHKDIKYT
jgi:hypothetical protein